MGHARSLLGPLAAAAAVLVACVTTPEVAPPPPPPPPPPELNVDTICDIIVTVDDAGAQGALVPQRRAYELTSSTDRHSAFGLFLAEPTPEERFRAFHADAAAKPASVVGPLGECIVYGTWSKMRPQAEKACAEVAPRLGEAAVLTEIAAATSALVHDADADAAVAIAEAGLKRAPGCSALKVARAQAIAAHGDAEAARVAWRETVTSLPKCFRCLTASADAEERADASPAGRAVAAGLWERALAVAPDHSDTLRRFAAVTAGVDDARALKAYLAAVKAGAKDYPTLLASARLATAIADSPASVDQALALAKKASEASKDDPEPRRLVVELSSRKQAHDDVVVAANALLDLVPDDVMAHLALARVGIAKGPLSSAVTHYRAAARAVADGAVVDEAVKTTLLAERQGLLDRLMVDASKAPKGRAAAVAAATQKNLQNLWRDRIKKRAASKGGALVVVVETNAEGEAVDIVVTTDSVGDPDLVAAAVAWLSDATITGGARRYTLEFAVR